jgi:hypothetical protein
MYVPAGAMIVAKNRYEARVLLEARVRSISVAEAVARAGHRAALSLAKEAGQNATLCGRRPGEFLELAQSFNACDTRATPFTSCAHVQASLRVTDHTLYHLMRRASVDSVVTLYQVRPNTSVAWEDDASV